MNMILALFWVWCPFGFICQEIAPFLQSVQSPLFFLIDALIMLMGLAVLKNKWDKIYVISIVVIGYYITCAHNGYSLLFYYNGLRDFMYLLWIIPIFRYLLNSELADEFIRKFDKTLFLFLIVQALCITFQFVKYGANDHGGGSMGNGFSGIASMLIYLISFYLMKKRFDPENYLGSLVANKWLIILLYPTFLNETKVSFILLALYFVLLLPINKKSFVKLLMLMPVMCGVLYLVFMLYMSATKSDHDITSSDFIEAYFLAEEDDDIVEWVSVLQERGEDFVGDGSFDIPRFTKYMMIPELLDYYPGHTITGFGVGQFKGGTSIKNSKFYEENEWLMRGSVPYGYHAFMQMGFFSILFFCWLWFRLGSFRVEGGKYRIDYGIVIYVVSMTFIIMLYNDFFRYGILCMPFFFVYIQAMRWKSVENKND